MKFLTYDSAMVLRKSSTRLPRRFNRPVTKETRAFAARRHARHADQRRDRWRRRKRRVSQLLKNWGIALRRWILLVIVGSALLLIGLVLFSPIVQVREIRVTRDSVRVDSDRVQRALVPIFGRHLLFLSATEVTELVRAAVPDLTDVQMDKQYPSRIVVKITMEPLTARLQIDAPEGDAAPATATGASVTAADFLTVGGRYVTHPTPGNAGDLPLIRIVDWGVRPEPGTLLITPELLAALYASVEAVELLKIPVTDRVVYVRAREFHLGTDRFSLWFDLQSPVLEQVARLKLFLEKIPAKEVTLYVDLRLSDRIVYR